MRYSVANKIHISKTEFVKSSVQTILLKNRITKTPRKFNSDHSKFLNVLLFVLDLISFRFSGHKNFF